MNDHSPRMSVTYEILNKKTGQKRIEKEIDTGQAYKVKIGLEVFDSNGNLKQKINPPFKSYVGNFGFILNNAFSGIPEYDNRGDIKDVDGVAPPGHVFKMNTKEAAIVPPNPSTYGIWVGDMGNYSGIGLPVGDSNTSIQFTDYDMRQRFQAEGYITGGYPDSGLNYGETVLSFFDNKTLRIKRTFTNNNTVDLIINEIGMVGLSGSESYLLARDSFSPAITIIPTDVVYVYYDISVDDLSGFVKNYLALLSSKLGGGLGVGSMVDINNNIVSIDFSLLQISTKIADAPVADDNYGILIGGRTTPSSSPILSTNSIRLVSKFVESDMAHKEMVLLDVAQVDFKTSLGFQRDFENVSGTNLYANEVGIFMKEDNTSTYFMLGHTLLLGEGVDYVLIAPEEILRVKFNLSFPLGSIGIA